MKNHTLFGLCLFITLTFSLHPLTAQVSVGDAAPGFKLLECSSKEDVSFESYPNAKGYIVVFTCNHCPYSKLYEDRLIALHKAYAEKGYPVIAINSNDAKEYPDDSFKNMAKRKKEKSFPFAYVYDESQVIAKAYGAERTPHVFLVQNTESGKKVVYIGAIDDSPKDEAAIGEKFVEMAIEAILKGNAPSPNFTKAIGCGIKWKKD